MTDACLKGMAFWYPNYNVGYYSPNPSGTPSKDIFYFEALCVVATLTHAANFRMEPSQIVIFSDNQNTVNMLSSLQAAPTYNHLLLQVSDILITHHHDLRVLHVSGQDNLVADALSHFRVADALDICPNLIVEFFQPP